MELHVLGAGATERVVTRLALEMMAAGVEIKGVYGAVGAVKDRFLAGESCDVLILTDMLIADLQHQGVLVGNQAFGPVRTGIAVREGAADPDIATKAALRTALMASRAIFMSDGEHSTAGRHFMTVLRDLEIVDAVAPYLRSYANGELAMDALARSEAENALGCTQITEIRAVADLRVVGSLPAPYDLTTVYAAAARKAGRKVDMAMQFIALLCDPASLALRTELGFEAPL